MIEITDSRTEAHALVRMNQLYAALSHISDLVLRAKAKDELFARICEVLVEYGKLKMAWIGWNDPATSVVSVASQYGDTQGYLREVVVRSDNGPEGQGPAGIAIRDHRFCVVNDFLRDPAALPWRDAATRSGFRSVGAFPIRVDGQVQGALVGYASDIGFFGPHEIKLIEQAARHLSFALDHLAGEARRQHAEAALRQSEARFRRMFEDTADALILLDGATRRITDCNQAAVEMMGCADKSEILSLRPADLSPLRQPDGLISAEKAETMISNALRNGSHRFEWVHCSAHRADFPVEVLLTPILMEERQILIATMREITERKRNERTQTALHQISDAARSAQSLPELFARIHQIIGELLTARNFFVALYDESKDELHFPYFVDEHDAVPGPQKLMDGTLSGRVIRTGEALLLTQDRSREGNAGEDKIVGTDSLDWLGVPLKSKSRTLGALVVQSYNGDIRYSEKDRVLLEFVSGQVAAAIESKQAEHALRESELRFRLLFEQNQAGVYRTLPDGQLLECNEGFARLLGYGSIREIIDAGASALYFRDGDRDRFLARLRAQGSITNAVIRLRRKDGGEIWGLESVTLIRGERGELDVIQGTIIDYTDRRRAEEELRRSESRLEEAQRLAHLGSWNWDLASRKLTWSNELCRIYGVNPDAHFASFEDFIGRVHPDDREKVQAIVSKALTDLKPISHELRIVRLDGEIRTLFDQCEVLVDALGHPVAMTGACMDITDRKLEEQFEHDRRSILQQVAQNAALEDILAHIVLMIEAQLTHTRCSVVLLKDGQLQRGAAPHLPESYLQALEGKPIGPAIGACAMACHSGRMVISEDIATDPLWDEIRASVPCEILRSCWSMPIPSSTGGMLGSLAVYRDHPARPDAHDLDCMATATQLAAVAIEHRLLTDQLEHQAQHDSLTGLPNRMLFNDRLRHAFARADRGQHKLAVLYLDLDRFKIINDTLGHSAGDLMLQQVTARLSTCIRKSDTLARLGGDEFIALITDLNDSRDALRVATNLSQALSEPFVLEGQESFISASIGISIYPTDATDIESLVANADSAMYRAKEQGRDNIQCFDPEMNALAKERMDLECHLRQALQLGQLSLHYQPLCDPQGEILGFEALMRWHHPTLGQVSPARFIPLAEESGLIVPMGEWALRRACTQITAWRKHHPGLRMSVNVSAVQFRRPDWVDTVVGVLCDTGLDPGALELEITESLIMQSGTIASVNLHQLRELGVGIAIDDFGTGYSSLSYLHKLPVTTLKIDQSFVRDIGSVRGEKQEDAPVIRTIIALARNFGLGVVAEGVETEAQRDLLVRLGCESLQGYLLHRPMTAEQAHALLQKEK